MQFLLKKTVAKVIINVTEIYVKSEDKILVKNRIIGIILIAFVLLGIVRFVFIEKNRYVAHADTESGEDFIAEEQDKDIDKAIAAVSEVEQKRADAIAAEERRALARTVVEKIHNGEKQYKEVLSDVYIAGDSLMETLAATDLINHNHLVAKVSASLSHFESNLDSIAAAKPPILITHYGENHLSTSQSALDRYISTYTRLIKEFQQKSPNTRIIISLNFPVKEFVLRRPEFRKTDDYNNALIKMCGELGVEYLDSKPVFAEHPKYEPDGIHMTAAFYPYWFDYIIVEKGIF